MKKLISLVAAGLMMVLPSCTGKSTTAVKSNPDPKSVQRELQSLGYVEPAEQDAEKVKDELKSLNYL